MVVTTTHPDSKQARIVVNGLELRERRIITTTRVLMVTKVNEYAIALNIILGVYLMFFSVNQSTNVTAFTEQCKTRKCQNHLRLSAFRAMLGIFQKPERVQNVVKECKCHSTCRTQQP